MARRPLEGVRILDCYTWWQGPLANMLLANLGAEVIKVESIQRYDGARLLVRGNPTSPDAHEWSTMFTACNHDKYNITLDLTRPKGVALLKELAKISDVITESYRPGVMKKFGLGYEDIKAIKPDIIYLCGAGYGSTGPWSHYVGYGAPFGQIAGGAYLFGYEDGPPMGQGPTSYSDPINAFHSAWGILVAVMYKKRTGKGQFIDASQVEQQTGFYIPFIMEYVLNGRVPGPQGNSHSSAAPHGIYQARGDAKTVLMPLVPGGEPVEQHIVEEKFVAIAVASQEEWRALCQVMGDPQWCKGERFSTALGRFKNRKELDEHINEWTKDYGHYELMHMLQEVGVPAAAVINHAEVIMDPHFEARKVFKIGERQITGTHPYPDFPFKLSKSDCSFRWASHTLGQDNEYIFKKYLGLTDSELEELAAEEIIGTKPVWQPVA